jgi:hypothetical protein
MLIGGGKTRNYAILLLLLAALAALAFVLLRGL